MEDKTPFLTWISKVDEAIKEIEVVDIRILVMELDKEIMEEKYDIK